MEWLSIGVEGTGHRAEVLTDAGRVLGWVLYRPALGFCQSWLPPKDTSLRPLLTNGLLLGVWGCLEQAKKALEVASGVRHPTLPAR